MRTGMEQFFQFIEAVRYAIEQIRIERRAWESYRRNQSPRTGNRESGRVSSPNKNEVFS